MTIFILYLILRRKKGGGGSSVGTLVPTPREMINLLLWKRVSKRFFFVAFAHCFYNCECNIQGLSLLVIGTLTFSIGFTPVLGTRTVRQG